ncbi:MAG: GTP-binding protein [Micromonosporaceae bacterium]
MDFNNFAEHPPPVDARSSRRPPIPVKIVIAGGFGVGKTTAVRSISDMEPLTTEAAVTDPRGQDDTSQVPHKRSTTVALDFGWLTIDTDLKLYLFGTPGQDRFSFMWNDIVTGALGALVIVDTRRLDDCYPAVDYFEQARMPFVVAINRFDGMLSHSVEDVRWALAIDPAVPVVAFDARDRLSVRDALLAVLNQGLRLARTMTLR